MRHFKKADERVEAFVVKCIKTHTFANDGEKPKILLYHEDVRRAIMRIEGLENPNGVGFKFEGVLLLRTSDVRVHEYLTY
jgi:hypothetical protein